ncbi:MAG: ABC transporter ATP-binding protein [Actinomycetota bacterium]|nr:ABC transporter ATP-binding protein [Actinomycetota bacterium]
MLSLERVCKVYRTGTFGAGELCAVSDVTFSIAPNEVVALVGESGSGKTTIGRMILRLEAVTSGSIRFDHTAVSALRRSELKDYYRSVQGVFQDPFSSFNPIFKADRVFKILRQEYFAESADAPWQARVDDALEAVGLNPADVLHKYPHQLSGGQLQRLLIARALMMDIRLLVADEIISMLDASTRIDVLNLLGGLKERGLGILFITHDLSLGSYIADTSIILRRGRIVEMGPTDDVFGDPRHPYTKALLAAVPRLHGGEELPPPGAGDGARAGEVDAVAPNSPTLEEVTPGHFVAEHAP